MSSADNIKLVHPSEDACVDHSPRLYEIDPSLDPRWRSFLGRSPNSSVFHTPEWLRALNITYGFRPIAYVDASPGDEISCGEVFCDVNSWLTGRRLISIPFSDHAALLDNQSHCRYLVSQLKRKVDAKIFRYIELRPIDRPDWFSNDGLLEYESYFLHVLSLEKDLETLFRNFHKDCIQRKIRRAERECVEYSEGIDETYIQQFYRLSVKTHQRHQSPPQPMNWFRNLAACLGTAMKIRVASKDSQPIAAMITIAHKESLVYKYGCSDVQFHKLGAVPFLFWKSIQDAKASGLRLLDMGRSDLDNAGLVAFKEHWGAQRKEISYWRYPSRYSDSNAFHSRIAKALLGFSPGFALRIAGNLLYRHAA